jgi:cellulose synthase/poly-beta-1,6-N-acetylglucosamine synthase-like glycosyltransferase
MRKVALLVPAHNEAGVVGATLKALLNIAPAVDIFVVDDGSKDATRKIALSYVPNVLSLRPNRGKANAMNACIEYFKLADRYEYILPMDADTVISESFLKEALPIFEADVDRQIACVVGKVVGRTHNWVTNYRVWEYEIAQSIHKAAQSHEGAIIVTPGCSTLYRAEIFKTVKIPTGTLAEDMDLTFMIHRKKLGRIVYADKATVVTQDPQTLKDLAKQIDRWYIGFWQCVYKHNVPWGGQMLDAELAMLGTEALFNGLLVFTLPFLATIALYKQPLILLVPILADLAFFVLPTLGLAIYRHKAWEMILHIPAFYVVRFLSCLIFFRSFLKVSLGLDLHMSWFKATRYKSKGRQLWLSQPTQ